MPIGFASLAFITAAVCVAVMGYAIQRGGTCLVAAVDEVVSQRRASRLLSLAEAALWVTAGLFAAHMIGAYAPGPTGYALTLSALLGGAVLGAGALINRACVFGAIARLGSGEWAYVLTPIGFFAGCLAVTPLLSALHMAPLARPSALFDLPIWTLALVAPILAWRAFEFVTAARDRKLAAHIWSPRQATTVIGVTFLATMLAVGGWAYTDLLAELAKRGMAASLLPRVLLFAALLIGAAVGGWTARRLRPAWPPASALARCFIGGGLMGAGSLLIPGGNDGLILVGLPLLQPHAFAAIAAMVATIAIGLILQRRLAGGVLSTAR